MAPLIRLPQGTDLAVSLRLGGPTAALAGAVLVWRLARAAGGDDSTALVGPLAVTLAEATEGGEYEIGQILLTAAATEQLTPGGYYLSWRTTTGAQVPAALAGVVRVQVTASGPRELAEVAQQPAGTVWTLQPLYLESGGGPVIQVGGALTIVYPSGAPVSSHADLTDRDAPGAHPLDAIVGLPEALEGRELAGVAAGLVIAHESAVDPHPGYTLETDPRLSDARQPLAHTHPLTDLQQGGAEVGQVVAWTGTEWAPADVAGGGAPAAVQDLGTRSSGEIVLDCATYGGGTLTLTSGAGVTARLSGATPGAMASYRLRLILQGPAAIVWEAGYWPAGDAIHWTNAGVWAVTLTTVDGGTTVDLTRVALVSAQAVELLRAEFAAPDGTLLEDYSPEVGPILLRAPAEGVLTRAGIVADVWGGALRFSGSMQVDAQASGLAWLADFGRPDIVAETELPQASVNANHVGVFLRVHQAQTEWVMVSRTNSAVLSIQQQVGGTLTALASITLGAEWTNIPVPVTVSASGYTISLSTPAGTIVGRTTVGAGATRHGLGLWRAATNVGTETAKTWMQRLRIVGG